MLRLVGTLGFVLMRVCVLEAHTFSKFDDCATVETCLFDGCELCGRRLFYASLVVVPLARGDYSMHGCVGFDAQAMIVR